MSKTATEYGREALDVAVQGFESLADDLATRAGRTAKAAGVSLDELQTALRPDLLRSSAAANLAWSTICAEWHKA